MKNTKKNTTVRIIQEDGSIKEINIYVVRPNNNTIKNADRYRATTWNQCITDGVLTRKELAKILEERGIWNSEKSEQETIIANKIQELERKLYLGLGVDGKKAKISEGKQWALEMRRLRIQLRDLISEKIALERSEEHTSELQSH